MRLHGKNFQPWADFDLEIDGLTVLVGPSNKGKSSLYRALKGILRNKIPDEFVRNNQDEPLEVELELDGHHIKVIRKKKGSTKYIVDGKVYTSLNGKVPEEIEKLKFGEVKIGEYTLDPIFAGQNKAQFLIDDDRWKASELNAILGAFSSTEKLDAGKKEANSRITSRKSEASTLASEIRSAEERSAALLEITGEASVVAGAVHDLEKGIRGYEAVVGQLGATILHQSRLEPLQEVLDTLTLPDLTGVTTLAVKAGNAELAADSFTASRFLRRVETSLDEAIATWRDLLVNAKKVNGLDDLLSTLDTFGFHRTGYADQLTAIISQVETELTEVKALNSSIAYLASASAILESLCEISDQTSKQSSLLIEAEDDLEVVRQEYAAEEARKKAAAVKPGTCPKCGKGLEHVCQ